MKRRTWPRRTKARRKDDDDVAVVLIQRRLSRIIDYVDIGTGHNPDYITLPFPSHQMSRWGATPSTDNFPSCTRA